MKITLIILSVLVITIIISLFIYGMNSRKGVSPGLVEGMLSRCPAKPNCVCSERKDDVKHYIKPIVVSLTSTIDQFHLLKNIIQDMGGVLQSEKEHYLAYYFSSAIFGFVDDVEIRFDQNKNVIHFRSSSRMGTSDFGVNRKRIELLKRLYQERIVLK